MEASSHITQEQQNAPGRLLHKDNVRQITVLEIRALDLREAAPLLPPSILPGTSLGLLYPVVRSHSVSQSIRIVPPAVHRLRRRAGRLTQMFLAF
jgi:hypothetical protein